MDLEKPRPHSLTAIPSKRFNSESCPRPSAIDSRLPEVPFKAFQAVSKRFKAFQTKKTSVLAYDHPNCPRTSSRKTCNRQLRNRSLHPPRRLQGKIAALSKEQGDAINKLLLDGSTYVVVINRMCERSRLRTSSTPRSAPSLATSTLTKRIPHPGTIRPSVFGVLSAFDSRLPQPGSSR
jgi:hypothetical protein